MQQIGASTVLRVIEWFILFVMLSALSTETQLSIILKILKIFGALFVHLTIDGLNYYDYYDIANLFNEYFANISSSVQLNHVSDLPNWERIADYVDSKLPSGVSYRISPISENFVRSSLQQLSTGKATGLDDLSSYFLISAFLLVFFLTFGKLRKSRHCIKMVRCLTYPIIAQYQFWLLS